MSTPLLGWIPPEKRTKEQHDAHYEAQKSFIRNFAFRAPQLAPGDKILLTDSWKHPDIVKEVGMSFNGFRQLTGSCVGVSEGNWVTTCSFLQRLYSDTPTQPFVCFWPFPYGRCRYNEGDRGQGEGAVDSVMGDTIEKDGYFDITQSGLPQFDMSDGLALDSRTEYAWSDGASSLVTKWIPIAKQHVGKKIVCNNTDDIWNAIATLHPVIDGCNLYVGNGSIAGSSDTAYVRGHYDGRGGHSTCFLGIWNHPTYGRLFLYSNQWAGDTYPNDPAGAGRCCVWLPESEVAKGFSQYGMDGGETLALQYVDWKPADVYKYLNAYI